MNRQSSALLRFAAACLLLISAAHADPNATHLSDRSEYVAPWAAVGPIIDGKAHDAAWNNAKWRALDQLLLGPRHES